MEGSEDLSLERELEGYGSKDSLDHFLRSFKHFGSRARQELSRAERYCEYLSCLTITVTSTGKVSEAAQILNYGSREEMLEGVRRVVKNSIRETDITSGFKQDRLALLLVETPRSGADSLSKRLQQNIQDFLVSNVASEESWKVSFTVLSFPDTVNTRDDFLAHLDSLAVGQAAEVS